jgi:hypothetical protein
MSRILNKTQMQILYIVRALVVILALAFLGVEIWVNMLTREFPDAALISLLIFSVGSLVQVFRLNRTLKSNNGTISLFQVKCRFFAFGRIVFATFTYFFIMTNDIKQAFGFGLFMFFNIAYEVLIQYLEIKKNKKLQIK